MWNTFPWPIYHISRVHSRRPEKTAEQHRSFLLGFCYVNCSYPMCRYYRIFIFGNTGICVYHHKSLMHLNVKFVRNDLPRNRTQRQEKLITIIWRHTFGYCYHLTQLDRYRHGIPYSIQFNPTLQNPFLTLKIDRFAFGYVGNCFVCVCVCCLLPGSRVFFLHYLHLTKANDHRVLSFYLSR